MHFARLDDWLSWQQKLHPRLIDPGLERIRRVLMRTGWRPPQQPVITVGGTNGKGSVVELLRSILAASGRRVGVFTSPHLIDYRERIRIGEAPIAEASLLVAFERITDALGGDTLTFFEYNTLAALLVFETACPDALLLEVGMGGRLDAVNVVDADAAIVVSVDLDHTDWLGKDIESIAREKAGIFRGARPAIFGASTVPASLARAALELGAELLVRDRDFAALDRESGRWEYRGPLWRLEGLPPPGLPGSVQRANAATALAALEALRSRLAVSREHIVAGLRAARLPGRWQSLHTPDGLHWLLDVAHNAHAARALLANLRADPCSGRTIAVCGMLADKDVHAVLSVLQPAVQWWIAASTDSERGLADVELCARALAAGVSMQPGGPVAAAMARAAAVATTDDRILCFGSFHTVGPALEWLRTHTARDDHAPAL